MDKELQKFFQPWELKILELVDEIKKESKDVNNVFKKIANHDSNCDDSESYESVMSVKVIAESKEKEEVMQ